MHNTISLDEKMGLLHRESHWDISRKNRSTNGCSASSLLPSSQTEGGWWPRAIFLSFSFFGRPTFITFIVLRGSEIKRKEAQIISRETCARRTNCRGSVLPEWKKHFLKATPRLDRNSCGLLEATWNICISSSFSAITRKLVILSLPSDRKHQQSRKERSSIHGENGPLRAPSSRSFPHTCCVQQTLPNQL